MTLIQNIFAGLMLLGALIAIVKLIYSWGYWNGYWNGYDRGSRFDH